MLRDKIEDPLRGEGRQQWPEAGLVVTSTAPGSLDDVADPSTV